jgi:hypothetical protein
MLADLVLGCDGKNPQSITFESLFDYKGKKPLKKMKSVSAVADTTPMSLSYLGELFPSLQILRLNNSIIQCVRDFGTQLPLLRVLSLEHCKLNSLNGICSVAPRVEELLVGFNEIDDLSDLLGLNSLRSLNLESNMILQIDDVGLLKCCPKLRNLVLRGNRAADEIDYREETKRLLPRLHSLYGVLFDDAQEEPEPAPPAVPVLAELPKTAPVVARVKSPTVEARGSSGAIQRPMVGSRKIARPVVRPWHNVGSIRL